MSSDGASVWSFGDGDYGKLGHGNTNRILVPQKIESLQGLTVRKVLCGAQFSVILTKNGVVYTCGQGMLTLDFTFLTPYYASKFYMFLNQNYFEVAN